MCVYAAITVNDKQMRTLKSLIKISINTHRTKAKMAIGAQGGECGQSCGQSTWGHPRKICQDGYFKV